MPDKVVPVFIKEWMSERTLDQKTLAIRMGRSEGAISKKFKDPSKIDLLWLTEFATALRVSVPQLFAPPLTLGGDEGREASHFPAKFRDAMALAEQLSDEQIHALLALAPPPTSSAPREEDDLVLPNPLPTSGR